MMSSNQSGGGGGSGNGLPRGISLSNTVYGEVAPCLPLPMLPVFCGALDQELRLFEESRSLNRADVVGQASRISDLLRDTDVSYLNLIAEENTQANDFIGHFDLYNEVLRCSSGAFEYANPGPTEEPIHRREIVDQKPFESRMPVTRLLRKELEFENHQIDFANDAATSKKPKVKKKGSDSTLSSMSHVESENASVTGFCEMLENFCGRAEILSEDRDETEWLPLSVADLRSVVNEIMSIRTKKVLHLVPVDILVRVLRVLDHQIHRAEGLSINECHQSDSDAVSSICRALESIHAALAIMAHNDMPKQLYKEEIIERVLEFSRHQIMDIMSAYDPSHHSLHKPSENCALEGEEDEEADADFGSASKKKRTARSLKIKKMINRVSAAVNIIFQKLCVILGFLKELCSVERLSDSCILQLVRTCFSTLLVENIQLLQLKAISLISRIFYSYPQHRAYVMDEAVRIFLKLPFSKRIPRTYHLPDDDQRQIQLITALLIQLVHSSSNLPESIRRTCDNPSLEVSSDVSWIAKCYEAVTEACCLFWSRLLERLTGMKNQEASEVKTMMENVVVDLLTTLNLPEYPASAPLLEVLCVLLLENAGLKSKDIAARSMAIDLLGTIAARLKSDAVLCRNEKFWIVQEFKNEDGVDYSCPGDVCSVCLDPRIEKSLFVCQDCQRSFHVDCVGGEGHEMPTRSFYCHVCHAKKQLLFLKSYCESLVKDGGGEPIEYSGTSKAVTKREIIQQLLLNYLQDAGSSDDMHLFTRWFYLCLWCKYDADLQRQGLYYVARLKWKAITRDSGAVSTLQTRDSVKKITLALGQNSSFSRGYDKILRLLLASLRENSPVIRAKALRAVSIIVEADPGVLGDKLIQTAVEGRFCDSAISVREAALELVGRHIASYPDVGLKYFEKVAERIKDTGVSVRKRAIRIIRDMCTTNTNFSEFSTACIGILSRINDVESSMQDLVCKTFYEFWFEEPSGSQSQMFGDGSCVPMEVAKKTEQIVEVLRRMPSHLPLVTVIKRNLALDFFPQSAKALGINPVFLASIRRRCELMCKCLLEKILLVTERNSEEGEVRMLPYVLLLHTFCVVDPTLCAPASDPSQFVVTLQPYLKSQTDNKIVAKLLESIIFVIDSVLPLVRKLPQNVTEELEQDLKQMIVRHSYLSVVHACIKCLCSVCKVSGKGATVIQYLIQLFFKRLDSLGFNNMQQVGRSLFCMGLLIRYGCPLLDLSSMDVSSSLALFKRYLQADDFVIKVRSLQALGYILIARPECMLEKDIERILEATLSSGTDVRLQIQSLANIYEYLLDAESQMGTVTTSENEATCSVDGSQTVPVAAGAGDTNICGGIVQLYWESILGRCLDVNEQVRQSALKIVEVVLRQGLVHPITCVPSLIALETDPQEVNSKLAHHLLMNMNEKYPAFFESRLGDGLQMSFRFMQDMARCSPDGLNLKGQSKFSGNLAGKSNAGSLAHARLGVSRIYKLIRGNRVSRNKFMYSVVRKFDTPILTDSAIPFLIYCTEILALLPFTLPDEPLYLIYSINRVIQVRAGTIESNMKAILQVLQVGQRTCTNGGTQQVLYAECAGTYSVPVVASNIIQEELAGHHDFRQTVTADQHSHLVNLGSFHGISKDDLQKIQSECLAAVALQLLLRVKRHLKIVYGLNDIRCQAYSPTEPPKPGEGLPRQNIPFVIEEIGLDPPMTYEDFSHRYQAFKNALKEDTVDYSTYTASIKRKRPTPRRTGKSGRTLNGDNEDDDDDEDWSGGMRKHNFSSRRSSSRSRQRLQL